MNGCNAFFADDCRLLGARGTGQAQLADPIQNPSGSDRRNIPSASAGELKNVWFW
jgi:hypothetical protein